MEKRRKKPKDTRRRHGKRILWTVGLFALLVALPTAWAIRARVTMPNGDRYTGEWLGSDGMMYRLRLDSGQELQLPLPQGGLVEFLSAGAETVPPEAVMRLQAALDAVELGMEDVAEKAFREAIALAPKFARAHYEFARFLEKRESSESFQQYVYAAQLDPTSYPIADKIRAAAAEAVANEDYLQAANALFAFARTFPEDDYAPQAAYDAATYFHNLLNEPDAASGLLDQTIAAYEYATRTFPDAEGAEEGLFQLGALYEKAKQPEKAILTLRRFLEMYPDSQRLAEANLTLGYAYLQIGAMKDVGVAARVVLDLTDDPDLREKAYALASEVAWTVLTTEEGLGSDEVLAIHRDGNYLWVGTARGVSRFDLSTPTPTVTPDTTNIAARAVVRAIATDENEVWIGTSGFGAVRYRKDNGTKTTYTRLDGLPSNRVDVIDLDDQEVWIGGLGGAARFDRHAQAWFAFTEDTGFQGRDVTCLKLTPGAVWVGTRRDGLFRFDRQTKQWEVFTKASTGGRLGSDAIRSLALSDREVFVAWSSAQSKGYSVYDPATGQWYNAPLGYDDIAPDETYLDYRDGRLWVALRENVLVRDPDGIWAQIEYPVKLEGAQITSLLADGDYIWVGTTVGLGRVNAGILQAVGDEGPKSEPAAETSEIDGNK